MPLSNSIPPLLPPLKSSCNVHESESPPSKYTSGKTHPFEVIVFACDVFDTKPTVE